MATPDVLRLPVRGAEHLTQLWASLMGSAGFTGRGLWLVFLDQQHRPLDLVIPIADLPDEAGPEFLQALASIVDVLLADGSARAVPMLLTRGGCGGVTDADRRWARALHAHLGRVHDGWPLHLATRGHVEAFAPEDLRAAG